MADVINPTTYQRESPTDTGHVQNVTLVDKAGASVSVGGGGGAVTVTDAVTPAQVLVVDSHGSAQIRLANSGGTELFTTTTPGAVQRGEGYSILTAAAVTTDPVLDCGDVLAYSWVSVHITTNASADTVAFQASNDNVTYVACTLFGVGATTAGGLTSATTVGMWEGVLPGRYFKLAHTVGANAVSATVIVRQTAGVQPAIGATVSLTPSTSSGNGGSFKYLNSAATTNATNVKNAAGILLGYEVENTNAAVRYVKFYNKASAPAPASDNALLVMVVQVPANGRASGNFGTYGIGCSSGIGFAMVTGASDTDNTAVGAGDVILTAIYK